LVINDLCKIAMKIPVKKITLKVGVLALGSLTGSLVVLVVLVGYLAPEGNRVGDMVRGALPLPVVVDGYHVVVTTKELAENVRSVRHFYEAQDFSQYGLRVDFSTDEGHKRLLVREKEVLNKMLEDFVVVSLAREQGIIITQEAAHDGVRRKLEEQSGTLENVEASLKRLYGWSLEDFEAKVVLPDLYEERLIEAYNRDKNQNAHVEKRIAEAHQALVAGASFSEVAARYSEGRTKSEGGAMGWFALPNLSVALQPVVVQQAVGELGRVVESEIGFHILVVEETKEEGDQRLYRLKQIFLKKKTAADWLVERMRASPPTILSREYVWDVENVRIEFRRSEMKQFEQKLLEEAR
jgi:hypothetical protein